jgi:hypothetical protein
VPALERVLARLLLLLSCVVVATLAMYPKLSLALLALVPTSLAVAQVVWPLATPDWVWIPGVLVSGYSLGAVILAVFFRRAGDQSGAFGALPLGREVRYSSSDQLGMVVTLAVLSGSIAGALIVAIVPPFGSGVLRVVALLASLVFGAALVSVWRLLKDRHIIMSIEDGGLRLKNHDEERFYAWSALAGFTFSLGIFRIYDTNGRLVARVDTCIDGFYSLLYHVNRRTFAGRA